LRERRKDILEIAEGFFESAKSKNNRASLRFAQAEREKLASADYDWPGNIRQLEKATQRAVLLHATGRDVTAQEILDAAKAVANLA
jgi:DNA-binding NtrC family response regulator